MKVATRAAYGTFLRERVRKPQIGTIIDYVTLIKPRETVLLAFIGICAAIIAGQGSVAPGVFMLALAAITVGSAGVNGLTNYLDRNVDARMTRTHLRSLPAKRIVPARRGLFWSFFLIVVALTLSWFLHPLALVFGLIGTVAASVFRKRVMCVIQGGIAGCAPVLIGYVAVTGQLDITILMLSILVLVWIPLHVWSVMIAYREDYLQAGVAFFPVTWKARDAIKVLVILSVILYAASIALWGAGNFGWLYFAVANILGIIMVNATYGILRNGASRDAWKLYKLSAFPYLGAIFIALCFDLWI